MNNFTIIYKILSILEKFMDYEQPDVSVISADTLKISESRLNTLLQMMADDGYISGLQIIKSIGGDQMKLDNLRITIKGLEYLNDNSFMKKASEFVKGTIDIIK